MSTGGGRGRGRGASEPTPVGDVVDRVVQGLGAPAAKAFSTVFSHWAEVVGDQVAAHTRPLSLRGGRLVVAVEEPGWATQLRWLEADLLRRLEDACGADVVTAIEVRVQAP